MYVRTVSTSCSVATANGTYFISLAFPYWFAIITGLKNIEPAFDPYPAGIMRDSEVPNFTLQDPVTMGSLFQSEASGQCWDSVVGILSINDLRASEAVVTSRNRMAEMTALSKYGNPS